MAADYLFVGDHEIDFEVPGTLGVIYNYKKLEKTQKRISLLVRKRVFK